MTDKIDGVRAHYRAAGLADRLKTAIFQTDRLMALTRPPSSGSLTLATFSRGAGEGRIDAIRLSMRLSLARSTGSAS